MRNPYVDSFTDENFEYKVIDVNDSDEGTVSIKKYRGTRNKLEIKSKIRNIGIQYTVISIEESAFQYKNELIEITVPNSISDIGEMAFSGCCSLEKIILSNSIREIEHSTFYNCESLIEIIIPESIISIESGAFANCTSLTEITLPENLTSIKRDAFASCSALKKITVLGEIEYIGEKAFKECDNLKTIILHSKFPSELSLPLKKKRNSYGENIEVRYHNMNATYFFPYNENYKDRILTVPYGTADNYRTAKYWKEFDIIKEWTVLITVNGITYGIIDEYRNEVMVAKISNCKGDIEISKTIVHEGITYNVTAIDNSAFEGSKLTSISLPDTITTIDENTFGKCNILKEIIVNAKEPIDLSTDIIDNKSADKIKLIVPFGASSDYKSAKYWSKFKTIKERRKGISFTSNEVKYLITDEDSNEVIITGQSFTKGKAIVISKNIEYGNETYTVTSIKEMAFCYSKLTSISLPNNITSIGSQAFHCCEKLTNIKLPNTITSIGGFTYCSSLASIELPNSITSINVQTFSHCTNLTNISFPNSIKSIGVLAFSHCENLNNISLPNSITSIERDAFKACTKLTNIELPDKITSINEGTFSYCSSLTKIILPEGITSIGSYAFHECLQLTNIKLPNTLSNLDSLVFSNCSNLKSIEIMVKKPFLIKSKVFDQKILDNVTLIVPRETEALYLKAPIWSNFKTIKKGARELFFSVNGISYIVTNESNNEVSITADSNVTDTLTIPETVRYQDFTYTITSIESTVYESRSKLTSVKLPEAIILIAPGTFQNCKNLISITLSNKVTFIGNAAFQNCKNLTNITLPDNVNFIGTSAFQNCRNLTNISLPEALTFIGNAAFKNCSKLVSVSVPDGITSINKNVFSNCSKLKDLTLPNGLTSIKKKAFNNCSALTNIRFPDTVKNIDNEAFFCCVKLKEVSLPQEITSVGTLAFGFCIGLTNITFPNMLKTTGNYSFHSCSELKEVTVEHREPLTINPTIFTGISLNDVKLNIPENTKEKYNNAAIWKELMF